MDPLDGGLGSGGLKRVRIALDAMGGDYAPEAIVEGAIQASELLPDTEIILVGHEDVVKRELARHGRQRADLRVVHAAEAIAMDEAPAAAVRKKRNSSIHAGMKMVRERQADAFISAGNTGAVMAVATVILRPMELIDRPAIAATMPTQRGYCILLDAGANVVCKPENLFQFGVMGSIYAEHYLDVPAPKVGLLSIGEEDVKGNPVTREAFEMFSKSSLNFAGNIEAKLFYRGIADVVVCDGFTGNISLKISESLAEMVNSFLKGMFTSGLRGKAAYMLLKPELEKFKKRVDHQEVGGAPLLGIDGPVFISHGSSSPKSIKSACVRARKFVTERVIAHIKENLAKHRDMTAKRDGGTMGNVIRRFGFGNPEEGRKEE